jgi:hypothetical protein
MTTRRQRVHALAMFITTRARVLLLMRHALASACEALPDAAQKAERAHEASR